MRSPLIHTRHRALVHRSIEDVYHFIAVDFFRNYRKWSPEVVELQQITAGEMGVGVKGRQVRYDSGHRSEATFRVTRMTALQELRFASLTGPEFDVSYGFESAAAGTGVTFDFQLRLPLHYLPLRRRVEVIVNKGGRGVLSNLQALLNSSTQRV